MSVILDSNIEDGGWPPEFAGGWAYIFYHDITTDTILCLFKDNDFPEGSVIEGVGESISLPQAYVSWKANGVCREIFVMPEYRNQGIGTALCAYARSYAYKTQNVVFSAPPKMTKSAQGMLQNVCNIYGEQYTNPEDFPPTIPYGYWGGYLV